MATKNYAVAASADDGIEISTTVTINGTNGVLSAAARYAGLSFDTSGDPIAQGETITSATLTYRPASTSNDSPDQTWKGHKVVNSGQYTTGASDISNRYSGNPTTATASDIGTDVGTGARNIDVTSIVQELVNQASWASNSRIGLMARPNGPAAGSIVFYDNGSNFATLQVVTADAGQPTRARARQIPGMRRPHGHQGW